MLTQSLKTMPALNEIKFKKPIYPVREGLADYLNNHGRTYQIPIEYADLRRYEQAFAKLDDDGRPTLWQTVVYSQWEMDDIHKSLVDLYQILIGDGSHLDHLKVDSVDFCAYGNSQPFRIKILNQLNDNHDYYYIKKADASRVYGLEMEHLLSPNKINYAYARDTLVEEHIIGIPGDDFIELLKKFPEAHNEVRLAKEFVKFNERCFVQLLGDMRAYNWVVVVNQDFDQIQYRIRSIDFDQQTYEGRHRIYLPQFYKENLDYVKLTQRKMSIPTAQQYVNEEQAHLRKRYQHGESQFVELMQIMKTDTLSDAGRTRQLAKELAKVYGNNDFKKCGTMAEILEMNVKARLGI